MLEVAELDRLSDRLSDIGASSRHLFPARPWNRRPRELTVAEMSPRLPPPRRLALTYMPPSPTVGSFAFAVRDTADVISIMRNRYAKAPILRRLNLREDEICLAAYLSDKGVAACPHAQSPGHEFPDSPAHLFSDAALAIRQQFEQPPFKLLRGSPVRPINGQLSTRAKNTDVPRLQYNDRQDPPPQAVPVAVRALPPPPAVAQPAAQLARPVQQPARPSARPPAAAPPAPSAA